jgi:ADP-heptose:LPS heptosyltransferase
LQDYIQWISEQSVLISLDSLGLHIATAMSIPVVGLFNCTKKNQIDTNGPFKFFELTDNNFPIAEIREWILKLKLQHQENFYESSLFA